MVIHTIPYGPLASNMYVISSGEDFIIVDPSVEPDVVPEFLPGFELSHVRAVLITHAHFDHICCAPDWQKALKDIPFVMSSVDAALLANGDLNCSSMTGHGKNISVDTTDIDALDTLFPDDGPLTVRAVPTPGHTAGSVTFAITDNADNKTVLFSGDTVFAGSVGRTDFPSGNVSEMMESVDRYKSYPHETPVYPGHGPDTTVGQEIMSNPFF